MLWKRVSPSPQDMEKTTVEALLYVPRCESQIKIYHYVVVNIYSTPVLKFWLHLFAFEKLLHCFEVGSFHIFIFSYFYGNFLIYKQLHNLQKYTVIVLYLHYLQPNLTF